MKRKISFLIMVLSMLLASCSSLEKNEDYTVEKYTVETEQKKEINEELSILYGENDPLGPFNRRMYYFNGMIDRNILKPVAETYEYYTPDFFQKRVSNFFVNFKNISVALNSFLQLKFTQGMETALRFGINSTFGILGLFDVASKIGIPQYYENLGMTLGHYGIGRGPYVVAPFLGPTNLRNISTFAVDSYGVSKLDVYHPVDIDFSDYYMVALYGFSTKVDSGIYFTDSDYIFEYEYMRFLSKKYNDILEQRSKAGKKKADDKEIISKVM